MAGPVNTDPPEMAEVADGGVPMDGTDDRVADMVVGRVADMVAAPPPDKGREEVEVDGAEG